ncbi:hypothetical protein [Azospirillum endophyticum]
MPWRYCLAICEGRAAQGERHAIGLQCRPQMPVPNLCRQPKRPVPSADPEPRCGQPTVAGDRGRASSRRKHPVPHATIPASRKCPSDAPESVCRMEFSGLPWSGEPGVSGRAFRPRRAFSGGVRIMPRGRSSPSTARQEVRGTPGLTPPGGAAGHLLSRIHTKKYRTASPTGHPACA